MVSFSAALSLRDHGIRPVAMLEAGDRIITMGPGKLFARIMLRTAVLCAQRLVSINATGDDPGSLASVTVEAAGSRRDILCDAVIFTGEFVPEAALLNHCADLLPDASLGPTVDQHWRTANPLIYAAGNVLRSVETAAWSAREGAAAAESIADDLAGARTGRRIPIDVDDPIKLVVPGALTLPVASLGRLQMQVRVARRATGYFLLAADGVEIWRSRRLTVRPERRHAVTRRLPPLAAARRLTLSFVESR
jgi:pyruvate/2-oxoglutarate dehydrogenase complex dihydrolipoamide dehydrogenase (E3) component